MIVFDVPVIELGWTVVKIFMATQGQSLLLIYLLVWPLLGSQIRCLRLLQILSELGFLRPVWVSLLEIVILRPLSIHERRLELLERDASVICIIGDQSSLWTEGLVQLLGGTHPLLFLSESSFLWFCLLHILMCTSGVLLVLFSQIC